MKALARSLAAATLMLGASAPAHAAITFTVNLTMGQEATSVPPTTSIGDPRPIPCGTATCTINDAMTQMAFAATIFNIDITGTQTPDANDNLVAAHIHVGTAPAATFPVRWGFFGTPDNDNNPDQLVVTPFATGVGGTFSSIWDLPEGNAGTTFATNLPDILAGRAYINFHTVQNGGGEIRGNFAGAIPEPSSWAMILLGFGLVGASLRFARKRVPALAG